LIFQYVATIFFNIHIVVGTMPASITTTYPPVEMIFFGKYNKSQVIIIEIYSFN